MDRKQMESKNRRAGAFYATPAKPSGRGVLSRCDYPGCWASPTMTVRQKGRRKKTPYCEEHARPMSYHPLCFVVRPIAPPAKSPAQALEDAERAFRADVDSGRCKHFPYDCIHTEPVIAARRALEKRGGTPDETTG